MLTLHQVEWCPACHRVRQVMTELGLTYTAVNVPARREERAELLALTDQAAVPVLQDGDRLVVGSDHIIEYLRDGYPAPQDAADHVRMSAYRSATLSSLSPRAALARLKELLDEQGLAVIAEVDGAAIGDTLPPDYTLLVVAAPVAAGKAVAIDPRAPSAVALPVAVFAAEGGSGLAAADPVGMVWLYGEPALTQLQRSVRGRVDAVFKEF